MVKTFFETKRHSKLWKTDLVELCIKSEEMKVPKISEKEAPVDPTISVKEQLKTADEGYLANPLDKENLGLSK